jgi:serine/threonine protein kinase
MGEIFLARQEIAGANRLVVLKRLLPDLAEDPQLLAMFIDEARIAANLAHPGIVQVYEFGQDAQGHFIVMEYVPGHHVGNMLGRANREHRPIPIRLAAYIMHEIARALDYAHNARDSEGRPLEIVHRDISPSNALVSFAGDVKLMDFGVARAANRAHRTNDGSVRGKFAYMAPEQVEGKQVDQRSDLFAAGVLLWELSLGRRLFSGGSDFETIRAVLEQPIPRPSSVEPSYPRELEDLVMATLERSVERRLPTAAALATGLKTFLRAHPVDRDDLATWMRSLYPSEAAESVKLVEELSTPPRRELPTIALPGSPKSPRDPATEPDIVIERPRTGTRLVLFVGLVLALGGGGYFLWLRYVAAPGGTTVVADASARLDTSIDSVPDSAAAAPVDVTPPVDAAVDAPIDAPASSEIRTPRKDSGVKPPHGPHTKDAGDDSAATHPQAGSATELMPPAATTSILFVGETGIDSYVTGEGCGLDGKRGRAGLTATCVSLVVGRTYEFTIDVPGEGTFTIKHAVQTTKPATCRIDVKQKRCK